MYLKVNTDFIERMEDENIIRQEAREFYTRKIEHSTKSEATDDIHELKSRLYDFYSRESKAIFLDEE